MDRVANQIESVVAEVPGAVGLENSDDNLQTQLRAKIDWTRAADLGVNSRDAGTALRAALDGCTSNANQFRQTGKNSIPIRVLTSDATTLNTQDIACLAVNGTRGPVQLGQFATFEQVRIPTFIQHVNRLHSVTIGVSAGQGHLVGDLQNAVQSAAAGVPLPVGYSVTYAGQGQQGGSAFTLFSMLGVAVLLGLLTSTLLTLVFVPAMYTIFDDLQSIVLRIIRRRVPRRMAHAAQPSTGAARGTQTVRPGTA